MAHNDYHSVDSPDVRRFDAKKHQVIGSYSFQKIVTPITQDRRTGNFPSQFTAFELKTADTKQVLGVFNLDIGVFANKMNESRLGNFFG